MNERRRRYRVKSNSWHAVISLFGNYEQRHDENIAVRFSLLSLLLRFSLGLKGFRSGKFELPSCENIEAFLSRSRSHAWGMWNFDPQCARWSAGSSELRIFEEDVRIKWLPIGVYLIQSASLDPYMVPLKYLEYNVIDTIWRCLSEKSTCTPSVTQIISTTKHCKNEVTEG